MSPVCMAVKGSTSNSVTNGRPRATQARVLNSSSSVLINASGALPAILASRSINDVPELPLVERNTSTLPAMLTPSKGLPTSTISPDAGSKPPQNEMRVSATSAGPSATPPTIWRQL